MTEQSLVSPTDTPSPWSPEAKEAADRELKGSEALADRFISRATEEPADASRFADDFLEALMLRADEGNIESKAYGGRLTSARLAEVLLEFEDIAKSRLEAGEKVPFIGIPSADDLRKAIIRVFESEFHDDYVERLKDRVALQRQLESEIMGENVSPEAVEKLGEDAVESSGVEEPLKGSEEMSESQKLMSAAQKRKKDAYDTQLEAEQKYGQDSYEFQEAHKEVENAKSAIAELMKNK